MLIQLEINDSQSQFFIDLITKLDNVVNNIEYIKNNTLENKTVSKTLMHYQEENGFSKNVLTQKSEDVWNDI